MRRRFPRTNDPNPLLIFVVWVGMDNRQHHHSLDHPDRVPSLLTIFKPVRHDEMKRIIENLLSEIERDTVLSEIAPSLLRIPFKLQKRTIDLQ